MRKIPTYIPAKPSDKIQERLYRYSQLVGGQYYDSWAHENGNEGTCEWFACEGEDEIISKKFAELRKCKRGEIVPVSSDITLMWEEYEHLMYDLSVTEGLIDFIIFNLQDIMTLADYQCTPEYFLWNMAKMTTVTNFQEE